MIGRNPEVMRNGRITGYCPVKRFVGVDIIKDPERWIEIEIEVDKWIEEASGPRE